MAYVITQHRRGTYEEWLELNIVPSDGELIIVEFENNVCKCKIGDGETPFSDLPYITDWLADEFYDKLNALQELTGSDLETAKAEIYKKLAEVMNEQATEVTVLKSDLTTLATNVDSLAADLNRVDSVVQTLIEPTVGALDAKYSEELALIAEQHASDVVKLNSLVEKKSVELAEAAELAINNSTEKMKANLANAETSLTADYTYKIIEAEDRLRASITVAEQTLRQQSRTINKLQSDINNITAELDSLIDEKIVDSETRTNARITEILGEIYQINSTIGELREEIGIVAAAATAPATFSLRSSTGSDTDIATLVEQLEDLQYKVNTLDSSASTTSTELKAIKTELSSLATSVANLSTVQKANYNSLLNALNSLETRLTKADADINSAVTAHIADVSNEITKLNATDTKLYTIIYGIEDKLIKKIDAADALIQAELDDDVAKLTQSITDATTRFDEQLSKTQVDLVEGLAATSADLTKKINNLSTTTDNKIGATDAALASLRASVSAAHTSTTNELEILTADVLSNKTGITSVRAAVSQVSTALDTKTGIINTNLENLSTRIDNQLAETEERLTAKVDVVDQHLQTQERTLYTVQNDVNDLVISLDNKITEKVLESKADTNASILEIREDIHQINLTLLRLGADSGTGSGSADSGDLLLLTEQLAALQTKVYALENKVSATSASGQQLVSELAELEASLTNLIASQKANNDSIASALSSMEARLSKANSDISEAMANSLDTIKEELIDLAADDVILYHVIYKVRDELLNSINKIQSDVQTELNDKTEAIDQQLTDIQTKLESDFSGMRDALEADLNVIDAQAIERDKTLESIVFSKTAENAKAISDLKSTVSTNAATTANELNTIATDVLTNKNNITVNKAAINNVGTLLDNKTKSIEASLELLDTKISAQEDRIGAITAFDPDTAYDPEKGYLADAVAEEVIDARLGHTSVANAIIAANNGVQELRNSLSQYIGTQAVDGLHYDTTGEVGLMQPYMLYLKAGNEVLQDSGVQIISGAGGGSGGGGSGAGSLKINYITSQEVKVTPGAEAKLYFTFSGEDSAGDTILTASATWRVDGIVVERGTIKNGENFFDATKYVKTGTIKVHLTVADDTGLSTTKSWNIQQIDLSIDSKFFDKDDYPVGKAITFDFIPTGAIDKVARFILDGDSTTIPPMPLDTTKSGTTEYIDLPPLTHGSHLLEVYLEADINGETVRSTTKVVKDIICFDASDKTKPPVIGVANQKLTVKQYSATNIIYTVYDPNSDTPTVDIKVDDVTVSADYTVTPNKQYQDTTTAVYTFVATAAGNHEIKIICGATEKVINIYVEDLGLSIAPVTTGLAFDFNPAGRSNGDANRLWSYGNTNLTVSDNFDWTNGGYIPDDPDGPCFCIKAGSSATIDYKLFADEAKKTGKEFKLVFKTKNVAKPDAVFLSCVDSKTSSSRVGVEMGVHSAHIYGKSGNLELAYSEEDVIEFEFNISKDTEAVPMVMGYEDGVPSRPMLYDDTFSFKQSGTPKTITLGSDDCDLYIYRFKVYNVSLSTTNILNNFIADARTAEEMISRYDRNQIYDENTKLTAESLAAKCPWLRVIKISAPKFTSSKKDDIANTTIQQIYGQGRASDNWVAYNAVHSGQGTSSDNYGAAGRNIDLKVRVIEDKAGNPINSNPYFLLSDNTTVDKVSLTDESIPVNYFNIKVNIASSNNLTNAIIAKRYNEFNPYTRPFEREDPSIIKYIKDTMEFYNCAVFIQETDPDLSTHREFADTDWHFYAIGNIGDSKKTDNTRATDPSDPLECCVEIMDVGLPLSAFPRDTKVAGHFVDSNGDTHYTWSKNENIGILYEFVDGEYIKSLDDQLDPAKTYYVYIDNAITEATEEYLKNENLCILYERDYTLTTDKKIDPNKTYYIEIDGIKTNAMEFTVEEIRNYILAKDENLGILYELSGYVLTEDTEVNSNKTYYIEVEGEKLVATEEQLQLGNPNAAGLYERVYVLTQDTTVDFNKTYYAKTEETDTDGNIVEVFSDAMGYTTEQVKVYKYATQENLDAGLLYEVTYFKTTDTEVADAATKTYYVDILEQDDFSEDYTYGWRYSADKKNRANCKQKWIEFYRFVTTSTDEEFKANLKDYFVVDSALYYYLFTTRYCMVDNRAKNTFWHYSKTSEIDEEGNQIRKWDLCWDYDNDTSLGLNNYGKQVYRYGLEDIDYDDAGEEVFRQSDSLFFCRIRDLFDEELKQMYQTLESRDAWSASAFINECDNWQNQFPEDLWRIDIERKYIRTYTKSFVNGKGDEQFLRDMANGRMKYHRRQWERDQEQYMASKYQTTVALGDAHHANFRVGRPSGDNLAVTPNYQFTLTPYSHIYLNVKYGGAAPISVRAKPNIPTSVPYSTSSADIINVGSAAAISDFGDLSALYPRTASMQNATRVKTLKLGNSTSGYQNPIFQRLTTGANDLLEELDLTNVISYTGALDLKKLINLKKLLAYGTSLTSVSFADGGKLTEAELPAVNNITLKRLRNLTTAKLKLSSYDNVVDLVIEGCPSVDQLSILESCTKVQRVRLDNISFGTKTYDYFANETNGIFKLKGLTATGDETDNAQLTGSVHFESLTGAQFNELRTRYPNLTVTYGTLTSTILFKDTDLETTIDEQTITNVANCQDPVKDLGIDAPTKAATQEFTYQLFGWSETTNIIVDYNDMSTSDAEAAETADSKKYNEDVLTNIEGDRTFYPVFKAIRISYPVHFMNPSKSGDILLQTVSTPYGKNAVYTAATPIKQDSVYASLYEHYGWEPKPENITGELTCWAQFAPPDQNKFNSSGETDIDDADILPGYTIGWSDLKDYPKYNTSTKQYDYVDGYSLNDSSRTLTITGCSNNFNPVLRIPDKLVDNSSGSEYAITTIEGFAAGGAFSGNTALKLIYLPDSLTHILVNSFNGCSNLTELALPANLISIGTNAFGGCTKLSKIYIPASVTYISEAAFSNSKLSEIEVAEANENYHVDSSCLIESGTNKLLHGCANAVIPDYVQSLGTYCFAGTGIQLADIPDGVTIIPSNAFNGCKSLTGVSLPDTVRTIDATCFNGCSALTEVALPEGLLNINTYAFCACALTAVEIPSTVEYVRDHAFGNMTTLATVTFNESADGSLPDIHASAFAGSGPITFYLPWSEEQHYATFADNPTFGAKTGSTLKFNS